MCYLKHDEPWLIALSKVQFHFAQTYRINNDFTKWFRWQPAQRTWDECWGGSGNSPCFAETALMFLLLLLFWIQALLSYWAPHHLTRFYDVSHMKRCCFNTAQAIVALFGAVSGQIYHLGYSGLLLLLHPFGIITHCDQMLKKSHVTRGL